MTIAFVVNACGLGVMAGSFIKTEKSFSVAGSLGTQIMAALGGSMVPLYVFPDWVISIYKVFAQWSCTANLFRPYVGCRIF